MKRVLITGATGFVGKWAVRAAVARGFAVHALTRSASASHVAGLDGAEVHEGDVLDEDTRRRVLRIVQPTHLLHAAWVTEHGHYWEAPENGDWVQASVDLARRFVAGGGRRLVTTGTCAEYDWTSDSVVHGDCDERATPCRPRTVYGRAKLELSRRLGELSGASYAWGRLFLLYGPREDRRRLVPTVIRSLLAGESARVGPGDLLRDFSQVQDVAGALVALLDSSVEGPVNIASGEPVSIEDLSRTIADCMGRAGRVEVGALPARAGDPPRLVAHVGRLHEEVGFAPRYSLRAGLESTISWWEQQRSTKAE